MNIKRQHDEHSSEYEDAAIQVLRSGTYIGGQEVELFEKEFALYEGAKYGIACGNGTDALVIALRALGIDKGDEVITVAWTFFATAESIASVGAKPVFIDVDKDTYCMDTKLIEEAITAKTKAILPVNFYGQACDMDELRRICQKYNLKLIVDCAQSTGTTYKGERKNTLGDISCFSFFPTKNLGCDGDGGMILTDDESLANNCRALRVHGSGKNGLLALHGFYKNKGLPFPDDMPIGESKYYNYLIGYNSRLDTIQAAILRKKLKHLQSFIERRRQNAFAYNKAFEGTSLKTPFESNYGEHSYYIYALKHKSAKEIMKKLLDKGIACGTYYPVPLHLQGAFLYLGYKKGDLPVTEELSETTFAIPVFPELYDDERDYIIKQVLKSLEDVL